MKWTPHGYQKTAIKFGVSRGCAAFLLDPGFGKTSITFGLFKVLRNEGLVKRMLVIAPLRPAYSVWPAEAKKWDEFKEFNVHVLHGKDKGVLLRQPHDISVINPEGLPWLFDTMKALKKLPWWDILVVDESTRFKHTQTVRFKQLKPHLTKFKRRYVLTGTPAPNGLLDLFGQMYILDLGNALGYYITHFRRKYFDSTGFGGYTWRIKKNAEQQLYKKLRPLALRMSGKEYLKMPPLENNTVRVELPPKARRAYTSMEVALVAELDSGLVTAANLAAAVGKCRQIANGGLYTDTPEGAKLSAKRQWSNIHDAKTEAVQELVAELNGKPALIAYEFKHDLDRLQKAFPDAPYIGGGVPPKKMAEIEAAWNHGLLPVLFAQPQSVAHGLNLQGVGAAVIIHSQMWDLENYLQFIRRVWRQGQKERVVVHHIIATGTVDEAILAGLARKDKTQRALLDALRTYLRKS